MADTRGPRTSGSSLSGFGAGAILSPVGLAFGFAGRDRGTAHFTVVTIIFMRWIAFVVCLSALAADPPRQLDIAAKDAWIDSGLDVRPGDVLTISATGTLK